jgi:capsular exopolysaccharide synthesis family protein
MNGVDSARGDPSVWTSLSIVRRYWLFAALLGAAVGVVVLVGTAIWSANAPTLYTANFEVRYRSGNSVLAGLSRLVGRDLPSLRDRSTIETQVEILRGKKLRLEALNGIPGDAERSEAERKALLGTFQVTVEHRSNTDIIAVRVTGPDQEHVQGYALGLLRAYRNRDVAGKRAKDEALKAYVEQQIIAHEAKLADLYQVIAAHREVAPLEDQLERSRRRVVEAEEALAAEARSRRNKRDALLANYTPEHPQVIASETALAKLEEIVAAQDAAGLAGHRGGAEAQWAALRQEAFDEVARGQEVEAKILQIRAGIGERFAELLRAGSDPEHVQREHRLALETYEGLRRRHNQVELSIRDTSSDVEVLTEPDARRLQRANPWRYAVMAGLLCGLLAPFVVESLVVTAHTVEDVERAAGLPVLAVLPKVGEKDGGPILPQGSAGSDELRLLRTNIESALDYPPRRLILVAGAEPGEGKSLIAVNLATVYAEMGVPTLLVDLDLRRPVDHELLKVKRGPGVTEVVKDGLPWKRAVQIPGVDNLHVLPAGAPVEDSGGLLATVKLAEVLAEMREVFSVVIVDSPALTAVSAASLVARRADAVVLVYALATTPQRSLQRTISMLSTAKAKILGVVANDVRGMLRRSKYRARR